MNDEWREFEERRERVRDGSQWIFTLGAVAAIAFLAGAHFLGKKDGSGSPDGSLEGTVVEQSEVRMPRAIAAPVPTYREPDARTGGASYVGVYECIVAGQRVVSDRPCGAEAQARTLIVDQPDPTEAARQRQLTRAVQQAANSSRATNATRDGGTPVTSAPASSNQAACDSIEQEIDAIDARMRQGYGSQQGERYRDRLRVLKERRYEYRCLGTN
jgi:hypothetical protein